MRGMHLSVQRQAGCQLLSHLTMDRCCYTPFCKEGVYKTYYSMHLGSSLMYADALDHHQHHDKGGRRQATINHSLLYKAALKLRPTSLPR